MLGAALVLSAAVWAEGPKKDEEEVDLDALVAEEKPATTAPAIAQRVPEHDYDRRLLAFPALLILILAWNVKWKPDPPPKRS